MKQPGSGALEVTWVWDLMDTAGVPNQTFAILSPNKLSRSSTGQGSSLVAGEDKEAEENQLHRHVQTCSAMFGHIRTMVEPCWEHVAQGAAFMGIGTVVAAELLGCVQMVWDLF